MGFGLLLFCFAVCSVGPGLFCLRRTRLAPAEKLVASVGLSYLLVYLGSFAWYLSRLGPAWQWTVPLTGLAFTLLSARDLWRLSRHPHVRRVLSALGLFLLWAIVLLSFVRHYGGGTWSGDWLEQYQRTLFFLHHKPAGTLMIGTFPLPARPPMMNLIAASFLAVAGPQYDNFQVVYLFLNALVFLPACLIACDLIRRRGAAGRRLPWALLLLLAANPMVAQNLTYAWSKLFTAFYVLLAIHLYLRGWRKGSRTHMVFAFASLCAGFIVHHSAGPYALFLGLHYVVVVFWRRRHKWAEAAAIGVVSLLILATWFGWSIRTYGLRPALASNSTVTDSAVMSAGGNALNIAKNLLNTLVPRVLQNPGVLGIEELRQQSAAGRVRDFFFLIYQVSLTFGLGLLGASTVGYLLYRIRRGRVDPAAVAGRDPIRRRERRFWLAFVLTVFIVGVGVYGGVDRFGVAHICLQAMVLIGLAFMAAGFRLLPGGLRWVLIAGLAFDLGAGVLLHLSLENAGEDTTDSAGALVVFRFAQSPMHNLGVKLRPDLEARQDNDPLFQSPLSFWGDLFGGLLPLFQIATAALFVLFVWLALESDRVGRPAAAGPPPTVAVTARPVRKRQRAGR